MNPTTRHPLSVLRHHVSGAVARGEAVAIAGMPAVAKPAGKRRIKRNVYGNIRGYVGRLAVWDFGSSAHRLSTRYAPSFMEWSPAEIMPCWFNDHIRGFVRENETKRTEDRAIRRASEMLYCYYLKKWEELRGVSVDALLLQRRAKERRETPRFVS